MTPEVYKDGFDLDFAKTTIANLCSIVDQVHKRGIVHRKISADVVGMKLSATATKARGRQVFKIDAIGGLDQIVSSSAQPLIENRIESKIPPTAPEV